MRLSRRLNADLSKLIKRHHCLHQSLQRNVLKLVAAPLALETDAERNHDLSHSIPDVLVFIDKKFCSS